MNIMRGIALQVDPRTDTILLKLCAGKWVKTFEDLKTTTALLDRLTHRCHMVETGNDS